MKKTKYTEQQIAFALNQAATGTRVEEVCSKMGISEATLEEKVRGPGRLKAQAPAPAGGREGQVKKDCSGSDPG